MSNDDLYTCPFCGSYAEDTMRTGAIVCLGCGASCPGKREWNRRSGVAVEIAERTAMGVLSGLSSYLGAGLGDDTTTAAQYDKRIRDALDDQAKSLREAVLREAASALNERGTREQADFGLDRGAQNFFRARDLVRALIKPANAQQQEQRDAAI